MEWKSGRKSICIPAHGTLFFMWNLIKTMCIHLFILQTRIFYHVNYLIKKIITWPVWHPYLSSLLHKFAVKIRCSASGGVSKVYLCCRRVHTLTSDLSEKCSSPALVYSNIAQQVFYLPRCGTDLISFFPIHLLILIYSVLNKWKWRCWICD